MKNKWIHLPAEGTLNEAWEITSKSLIVHYTHAWRIIYPIALAGNSSNDTEVLKTEVDNYLKERDNG